jgi:hypothetical protein
VTPSAYAPSAIGGVKVSYLVVGQCPDGTALVVHDQAKALDVAAQDPLYQLFVIQLLAFPLPRCSIPTDWPSISLKLPRF